MLSEFCYVRFWQQCCLRFKWHCAVGWVIPKILKDCSALSFSIKQSKKKGKDSHCRLLDPKDECTMIPWNISNLSNDSVTCRLLNSTGSALFNGVSFVQIMWQWWHRNGMCKVEHGGITLTGLKQSIWWKTCPGGTVFLYRLDLPGIETRPLLMVVLSAICQSCDMCQKQHSQCSVAVCPCCQ